MQVQCKVLKVSRSAFYKWRNAQPAPASIRREQLKQHIKAVHNEPRKDDYGSPRIHQELLKRNVKCSKNTVAKLMKQQGIRARTARTFRVKTTDSKHDQPIAKNLLNRVFEAQNVNAVWLTDFTYIDCKEGFVYLCTVQDLCSRRIVGWATSKHINARLALDALKQAVALRNPKAGLIVHSDRGSQFASLAYQSYLNSKEFYQSMSYRGDCYDNAPMESFFRSFKVEEVYRQQYETFEQTTRAVRNYIDRFYNRERLHSSIGYVSPLEFEQKHHRL